MESLAYIKNQRVSPKKLRFILDSVKKESPVMAMNRLYYTQKKGAKILYKAIKSAINNAKNTLKADENLLKFKTLLVEEGRKLKRHRAGGRGMVKPYSRRYSHIKIVLTLAQTEKPVSETVVKNKEKRKSVQDKNKKENINLKRKK